MEVLDPQAIIEGIFSASPVTWLLLYLILREVRHQDDERRVGYRRWYDPDPPPEEEKPHGKS